MSTNSDIKARLKEQSAAEVISIFHDYEAAHGAMASCNFVAASGRRVIAIDVSKARFDCMCALKAGLEIKYPALVSNALLVHGNWPQILDGHDPSQSLVVAADFVFTGPPDAQARAIAGLRRHKGAIVDGMHFVHTRLQRPERDTFYDAVQEAGLSKTVPLHYPDPAGNTEFVFTRVL